MLHTQVLNMTTFGIRIISDTVCPWCYVGYRRLTAAIEQHLVKCPDDIFSISWHPFQLNPYAPKFQSFDKVESYESKLGQRQANVVFERLRSAGQDCGITFSFKGRTGNTLDSHRLIEYAGRLDAGHSRSEEGRDGMVPYRNLQTTLVEHLFSAYFEHEQDIADHAVLVAAAASVDMDEQRVRKLLAGDELADQVRDAANKNRSDGINGVPHFTINDEFFVEGAQEPAAFLMLFNRLKRREANGSSKM